MARAYTDGARAWDSYRRGSAAAARTPTQSTAAAFAEGNSWALQSGLTCRVSQRAYIGAPRLCMAKSLFAI